jgi:hypothetical protein
MQRTRRLIFCARGFVSDFVRRFVGRSTPIAQVLQAPRSCQVTRRTTTCTSAFAVGHRRAPARLRAMSGGLLVVFIAPPWGNALDPISGLDLRMTQPPIPEIVDHLLRHFDQCKLLCAIQIYETIKPESLAELESGFEWRALRMYGLNAPGRNHGVLLGTAGWRPSG